MNTDAETDAGSETESEADSDTDTESDSDSDPETVPVPDADAEPDAEAEADPETDLVEVHWSADLRSAFPWPGDFVVASAVSAPASVRPSRRIPIEPPIVARS